MKDLWHFLVVTLKSLMCHSQWSIVKLPTEWLIFGGEDKGTSNSDEDADIEDTNPTEPLCSVDDQQIKFHMHSYHQRKVQTFICFSNRCYVCCAAINFLGANDIRGQLIYSAMVRVTSKEAYFWLQVVSSIHSWDAHFLCNTNILHDVSPNWL